MFPCVIAALCCLLGSTVAQSGSPRQAPASSYMILHPWYFRPGNTFSTYVRMLRPVSYETIVVTFVHETDSWTHHDNGTSTYLHENVTLATGSIMLSSGKQEGTVTLQIPSNLTDVHNGILHVRGTGIVNFENSTRLYRGWGMQPTANNNDSLILIQTDKQVYKTGEIVHYRVFAIDYTMRPKEIPLDITIRDPRRNKISEQTNVSSPYAISGHLELSDHPQLGRWEIEVVDKTFTGEYQKNYVQEFYVREYVLPKFEVKLKLPSFGTVGNPELKGTVTAKYTYGKPVEGHVTLTISKAGMYWQFFEPKSIQTEFEIDGEADFSIAMDTLLKFDPDLKSDTLMVKANVTEKLTGEVQLGHGTISFHEKPLVLQFLTNYVVDYFKPGFDYTTYIKVTQPDGRPLPTSGDRVQVKVTYFTDKPMAVSYGRSPNSPSSNLMKFISPFYGGSVIFMPDQHLSVPRSGVIRLHLDVPEHAATCHIEAKLRDQTATKNVQRFRSPGKAYLVLDMSSASAKVGDKVAFNVRSNVRPNDRVTYHVIQGQGRILETHFTSINSPYNQHTFYVTMTAEMVPECKIVAYFYHPEHSEIVADSLVFNVDMKFRNDVSLKFDKTQVAPGTNVSLRIMADPGSQVYVLAVDKSVLLHNTGGGNDISESKVRKMMGMPQSTAWKYRNNILPRRVNADDSLDIFKNSDVTVLTDANLFDFNLFDWTRELDPYERYGPMMCVPGSTHYACSADISESGWSASRSSGVYMAPGYLPQAREDFPETWMWLNESVSSSGGAYVTATVPDTITDWVATAFALHKDTGLGVTQETANVTAYLPFFVNLNLPFSVVKGEIAVVQALVFNYYPYDMYVTVTLKNATRDFVGISVNRFGQEEEVKDSMEKCILVKSNDAVATHFPIRTLTVGTINLEVQALSTRGRDTVQRTLVVKAPGKEEEDNYPVMITMQPHEQNVITLPLTYPFGVVPDSQRVRISIIGDMFESSIHNLDRLVRMPYGSGEQVMVTFAPAVSAARYLEKTGRYDGDGGERVIQAMMAGYQRILPYLRLDGSFSNFDFGDQTGSLWLTAFVMKTLAQASEYVYIDPDVIEKAVNYTIKHQETDGSFNATGNVYHKSMQGGSAATRRSLAAYVLIAMHEVQDKEVIRKPSVIENLRKAMLTTWSYLNQNASRMSDDYEMAISAYALALMSRGGDRNLLAKLDSSRNVVIEGKTKYWRDDVKTHQIEVASYYLLAKTSRNLTTESFPVFRWLLEQRNPSGGFVSTQDTVVGLQALAEFAAMTFTKDVDMTVTIETGPEESHVFTVNASTRDILQFIDIPAELHTIQIKPKGRGKSLVEVSKFYNLLAESKSSAFDVMVTTNGTDASRFTVKTCARWRQTTDNGLVVIDIGFPSGYSLGPGLWYPSFKSTSPHLKHEVSDGRFVVYYKELEVGGNMTCVSVDARRDMTVGRVQPASVRVYSYYDSDKSAMKQYLPEILKKDSLCDVCGVECGCKHDPDAVPMEHCKPGFRSESMWSTNARSAPHSMTSGTRHVSRSSVNVGSVPHISGTRHISRTSVNAGSVPHVSGTRHVSRSSVTSDSAPVLNFNNVNSRGTRPSGWRTISAIPNASWANRRGMRINEVMPPAGGAAWSRRRTINVSNPAPANTGTVWNMRTLGQRGPIPVNAGTTWSRRRTIRQNQPLPVNTGATWHRRRTITRNNALPANAFPTIHRSRTVTTIG